MWVPAPAPGYFFALAASAARRLRLGKIGVHVRAELTPIFIPWYWATGHSVHVTPDPGMLYGQVLQRRRDDRLRIDRIGVLADEGSADSESLLRPSRAAAVSPMSDWTLPRFT